MQRIDSQEAIKLYKEANLFDLGARATEIRLAKADSEAVTYIIDRNINYTNICITPCKFCAFFRIPGHEEGYILPEETIDAKIDELVALDGTQVLLQGGLHPDLPFSYYTEMIARLKERYPQVNIHGFSPPEIVHFANISGTSSRRSPPRPLGRGAAFDSRGRRGNPLRTCSAKTGSDQMHRSGMARCHGDRAQHRIHLIRHDDVWSH